MLDELGPARRPGGEIDQRRISDGCYRLSLRGVSNPVGGLIPRPASGVASCTDPTIVALETGKFLSVASPGNNV